MNKTQIKKEAERIYNALAQIRDDFDNLKSEAEENRDSIEPYEGRNELTPEQEERQTWYETICDYLDEAESGLDSLEENLTNVADEW